MKRYKLQQNSFWILRWIKIDDEKLEMFNKTGMVMEIHEDDNNKNQSVLVLYSKNVSEPYSIHLQEKYINDKNREINTNNRIIVNSQLDNN